MGKCENSVKGALTLGWSLSAVAWGLHMRSESKDLGLMHINFTIHPSDSNLSASHRLHREHKIPHVLYCYV